MVKSVLYALFMLPGFMERKDLSSLASVDEHDEVNFKLRWELKLKRTERMTNILYNSFFLLSQNICVPLLPLSDFRGKIHYHIMVCPILQTTESTIIPSPKRQNPDPMRSFVQLAAHRLWT